MKFILSTLFLLLSSTAFSKVIHCDYGFEFDTTEGSLRIPYYRAPESIRSFLNSSNGTDLFKNNFNWNGDSYFSSDRQSTVQLYYYNNGEKALSFVGKRWNYDVVQVKISNCDF